MMVAHVVPCCTPASRWEIVEDDDGAAYLVINGVQTAIGRSFDEVTFSVPDTMETIPAITQGPDLWWLIDLWHDEAARALDYYSHAGEPSLTAHRIAHVYEKCADQLAELAGPRAIA